MSNIKPDDFRKHAAEEEFFRLAAMEIESEQNEEFLEAQSLPDPSPEVLARMQKNLQTTMRKTRKRKRRRTIFLQLGRLTACMAVVCGVLFSGAYFGVEASRNSINNFVLEFFDDHAVVSTDTSESNKGASLPINWDGPFYVTWVPERFINVRAINSQTSWKLIYASNSDNENLSIYVWSTSYAPYINIDGMKLLSEEVIQNGTVQIYADESAGICTLLWEKDPYLIQIGGTVSASEVKEIAQNFKF